jgi:hypothetical protein
MEEEAMKPALLLATIVFTFISIAHLLRFMFHVDVTVGGAIVPMWMSGVAFLFTGGLAVWLALENRRK